MFDDSQSQPTTRWIDGEDPAKTRRTPDEDPAFDDSLSMADRGELPHQNPKFGELSMRLTKRFGGGDQPHLRIALFDRVQRECCKYGEVVYRIVASAARSSESAREPDRYFCSVVSRRLREAGFMQDDQHLV